MIGKKTERRSSEKVITVISLMSCDPTLCSPVFRLSVSLPSSPQAPTYEVKHVLTVQPGNPRDTSMEWHTAEERKQDVHRSERSIQKQDGWRQLQWRKRVFTSQRISNTFFDQYNHRVLLNQRQKLTKRLTATAFEQYLINNGNKNIHVERWRLRCQSCSYAGGERPSVIALWALYLVLGRFHAVSILWMS